MSTLRIRRPLVAVVLVLTTFAAACAPAPPESDSPRWFDGGTFPVEVSIPATTTTASFPLLFGLGTCTTTLTSPAVAIPEGSLTLAAAAIDPVAATVEIPGASLELPGATVSLGSLSLSCNGGHIGTLTLSLRFDGAASVATALLDPAAGTVTFEHASVSVSGATLRLGGVAAGAPPIPLPAMHAEVPTVTLPLGSLS